MKRLLIDFITYLAVAISVGLITFFSYGVYLGVIV